MAEQPRHSLQGEPAADIFFARLRRGLKGCIWQPIDFRDQGPLGVILKESAQANCLRDAPLGREFFRFGSC
jgi:hypothetical protein